MILPLFFEKTWDNVINGIARCDFTYDKRPQIDLRGQTWNWREILKTA
jgi:hypothetical protein